MDLPLPGKPEPPDSPCISDVLRFWEDSVLDFPSLFPVLDGPPPESVLPPSPDLDIFPLSTTGNGSLGENTGGTLQPPDSCNHDQFVWNYDQNAVIKGNGQSGKNDVVGDYDISTLNEDYGYCISNEDVQLPIMCHEAKGYNAVYHGEGSEIVSYDGLNNLAPFPLPPLPSDCDSCQVLRQIVHSNGVVTKRLEIHQTVGNLYHAICAVQFETGEVPIIHHELAELQHIRMANPVLVDYFRMQEEEGHALVHDSNNNLNGKPRSHDPSSQSNDLNDKPIFFRPFLTLAPPSGALHNQEGGILQKVPKSPMAIQRERTGKMTLEDLKQYMHLPIAEAARRLYVCPTVVKKVCRRNGLARWPYRKIRSLDRSIDTCERNLEAIKADNIPQRTFIMNEIEKLRLRKEVACRGGDDSMV